LNSRNIKKSRDSSSPILVAFLFICLALLIYSNVLGAPFVHDDVVFIKNNPQINDLSSLGQVFFQKGLASPRIDIANAYHRPLLEIINRVLFRSFGPGPLGYHVFNVVLHALNAFLLWFLIRRLGFRDLTAWMTALLFLAHPVQSEAVACISGLSNLLSAFFGLAALGLFVWAMKTKISSQKRLLREGLIFLLVLCGLFAKESTVVIPLVMIFIELFFVPESKRFSLSRWRLIVASSAAVIVFLVWRQWAVGVGLGGLFSNTQELWLRVKAIPDTLLMYGRVMLIPRGLHYYRSMDILNPGMGAVRGTLLLVLIVLLLGSILRRKADDSQRSAVLFGVGWFILTLLPMLNIIPLIHEYSFIAAFEHFLYLPMIGAVVALTAIVEVCWSSCDKKWLQNIRTPGLVLVIVLTGLMTYQQNWFWQSEVALFERAVRFEPRMGRVRLLLGKAYYRAGRFQEAAEQYEQALLILTGYWAKTKDRPAEAFYAGLMSEILFDLAHCHENLGQPGQAIQRYQQALQLKEGDSVVMTINLGAVYLRGGDLERAKASFRKALELDPDNSMAKTNLAVCALAVGEHQKAERLLREVLAKDEGFLPARQNLEMLLNK